MSLAHVPMSSLNVIEKLCRLFYRLVFFCFCISGWKHSAWGASHQQVARLAQSVEHETLNLRVVGSSPTLGDQLFVLNSLT